MALAVSIAACASNGSTPPPATGGGGTSSSAADAQVASTAGVQYTIAGAKALVARLSKLPAGIGVATPLGVPAPRGKTIVALDPGSPVATVVTQNLEAAAKVLDWKVTRIVYQSTSQGQQSAMQQAIQDDPNAIVEDGMTAQVILPYVKQMKDVGIKFISDSTAWSDDPSTATDAIQTSAGPDVSLNSAGFQAFIEGDMPAAWAIANTNGHVRALTVYATDYPVLLPGVVHFGTFLHDACPKTCSAGRINVSSSDIGVDLPSMVVSALQRQPDTNYINCVAGQFCVGVAAAIRAAGFNNVKIIGAYADQASLNEMQAHDTVQAYSSFSFPADGWREFDAALRAVAGAKIASAASSGLGDTSVTAWNSTFYVTKATDTKNVNVAAPADYQALFEKLWGIQ
jgi:ribose transport system substrate-binding protein